MSDAAPGEVVELKAAFDAGLLDAAGRAELLRRLRDDADARAAIADDAMIDRLLRFAAMAPDASLFVHGVRARRDAERSGTRFVRRVRAQSRRRRPRRGSRLGLSALASLAAVLVAMILLARPTAPVVDVALTVATATTVQGLPAEAGRALVAGDQVDTAPGGEAGIAFADGSTLALGGGTRLRITGVLPAKALRLDHGSIAGDIIVQPEGRPLTIDTPHGRATVIGTRFRLTVGTTTRLTVSSGLVRLADAAGARHEVASGGEAEIGAERTAVAPAGPWGEAIVHYDFRSGGGALVRDLARRGPPLDLHIAEPSSATWRPGVGLSLSGGGLGSLVPADKLAEACLASDEISIFAVITPAAASFSDPPADYPKRLIGITDGFAQRGFLLGQGLLNDPRGLVAVRLRTATSNAQGKPSVVTTEAHAEPRRLSLAVVRQRGGATTICIDGRPVPVQAIAEDSDAGSSRSPPAHAAVLHGALAKWRGMPLVIGAEMAGDQHGRRAWSGTLHVVAVFARALTAEELLALDLDATR